MMPRFTISILAGLTAVQSVAGASLRSEGVMGQADKKLVEGRRLQAGFCNSIGCPAGFTPIPMAWETECTGGICEVSQCCEAFCSYYACPDGKTPVGGASEIQCTNDLCTEGQCCEAFCSYHPCPNGYIPVVDAGEILCTNDECTDAQCCVFLG